MKNKQLPINQISKLADDVRLIQNFTENHDFDSSLLFASISPTLAVKKSKIDTALISMIVSIVLFLGCIAFLKFAEPSLSKSTSSFVFLVGLMFITITAMASHRKFNDKVVTTIVVFGMLATLLIGAEVITILEALDKAEKFAK